MRNDQSGRHTSVIWLSLCLGALLAFSYSSAWAAPLGQEESDAATRLWPILLAMFAASTVVERGIELLWNYSDWFFMNARQWQPAQLKSAQYVQFKSGTSLLIGAAAGVVVANITGMKFLSSVAPFAPQLLGGVPVAWDVVLTGLLIGAGAKLVHDLYGIVTGFKNWLGASAVKQREGASAALAEGVLKMAQSDAQSMIDVPGVGPARLQTQHGAMDGDGDETEDQGATLENYADVLRNRASM